jgi:hypothetical protein
MATIPELIRITREGDRFSMTVDGEEFPYAIAEDDIEFSMGRLRSGMVRLTLIADRVEVVNDFHEPRVEEVPLPDDADQPVAA